MVHIISFLLSPLCEILPRFLSSPEWETRNVTVHIHIYFIGRFWASFRAPHQWAAYANKRMNIMSVWAYERVSEQACEQQQHWWQLSAQCFISFFNSILFGVRHFQHANSTNHSSLRHRLQSGWIHFLTLQNVPSHQLLLRICLHFCCFWCHHRHCSFCFNAIRCSCVFPVRSCPLHSARFAKFTCVSFNETAV